MDSLLILAAITLAALTVLAAILAGLEIHVARRRRQEAEMVDRLIREMRARPWPWDVPHGRKAGG